MTNPLQDIQFNYSASTNVGIGDDGVNAFPIKKPCETRLAAYASEFIFNLTIAAYKRRNLKNILHICINEVGIFNNINAKVITNIYNSKDIPEKKIVNPTLILADLDSLCINVNEDKDKDLNKILNLINDESLILIAVDDFILEGKKEKRGSIREIIINNDLFIDAFIKVEPGRFESLMTEQTESLNEKPPHYYGFYILAMSRNKREFQFVARLEGPEDPKEIIEQFFHSLDIVSSNSLAANNKRYAWLKSGQFYSWDLYEKEIEYEKSVKLLKNYKFLTLKELCSTEPVIISGKKVNENIDRNSIFLIKNKDELFSTPFITYDKIKYKEEDCLKINLKSFLQNSNLI